MRLPPTVQPDPADQDVLIVGLTKGDQRYAIYFTDRTRRQAIHRCAEWARWKHLPEFTWADALVLQKKIRELE